MRFGWLRKNPDPLARHYKSNTPRRLPGKSPLRSHLVLVVDAETTGFDVRKDQILTLAVVDVSGNKIAVGSVRAWLIFHPEARVNPAVAVHGILPSETLAGQPEKDVLAELVPVITGAILVGHHVGFDARMIDHALRTRLGMGLRNSFVDTAHLAMAELEAFKHTGYPNQRPPSLEEVCQHLGLPMHDQHTAAGDAFTTAQVFLLLLARAQRRLGRALERRDLPLRRL